MTKLITVLGASGAQGGAVVQALLKDDDYTVQAAARDIEGPAGDGLRELGAKTVNVDFDDRASIQKALSGAYGVFLVTTTDFKIEKFYETEVQQGKNVVDACSEEGVQHLIFSTMIADMYQQFGVACAELDAKVEIHDYIRSSGLPQSGVMMSFYYENILTVFKPQKLRDEATYGFGVPLGDVAWAMASVEDLGEIVRQMFRQRDQYLGRTVQVIREKRTMQQLCDTLNKYLEPVVFKDLKVSLSQFRKLPLPNIDQISRLFEITIKAQDVVPDTETAMVLNPNMRSFEAWVQQNEDKLKALYT